MKKVYLIYSRKLYKQKKHYKYIKMVKKELRKRVKKSLNKKPSSKKRGTKVRHLEDKITKKRPMRRTEERILLFGDMHIPYHHQDSIDFLKAIKAKYKPTKIICTGDEVDNHAISYHEKDPDLMGAGDELDASIRYMKQLYKIFPKVDLVESNHGSLAKRKGKTAGIPNRMLRSYNEILEAPKSWKWTEKIFYKMRNGETLYIAHQQGKNSGNVAKTNGCCYAGGHYHEDSNIVYTATPMRTIWGSSVGCLIDNEKMAFAYNRSNMKIPSLSVLTVTNGVPQLIPMVLNKKKRWIGKL